MVFTYRDADEFQEKFRSREERENALLTMDSDEIMHIVRTCGTVQGAIYYASFAQLARDREKKSA